MKTVADHFAEILGAAGVKRIYGIVGDSLKGLPDALRRQGNIEWIHVRHEEDVPAALNANFDVVFDTVGSLTPKHGDALAKRDGIVIDTVPTAYKFLRSLYSKKHAVVLGGPNTERMELERGL